MGQLFIIDQDLAIINTSFSRDCKNNKSNIFEWNNNNVLAPPPWLHPFHDVTTDAMQVYWVLDQTSRPVALRLFFVSRPPSSLTAPNIPPKQSKGFLILRSSFVWATSWYESPLKHYDINSFGANWIFPTSLTALKSTFSFVCAFKDQPARFCCVISAYHWHLNNAKKFSPPLCVRTLLISDTNVAVGALF